MPYVRIKCPECGGIADVDDRQKAIICKYCAQPISVEEGAKLFKKDNYWITNNENINI